MVALVLGYTLIFRALSVQLQVGMALRVNDSGRFGQVHLAYFKLMYVSKDVFAFFLASDCQVQNT